MTHKPLPTPYYPQEEDPQGQYKTILLSFLEKLAFPTPRQHSKTPCNQECHILERNHVIELIKDFIRGGPQGVK